MDPYRKMITSFLKSRQISLSVKFHAKTLQDDTCCLDTRSDATFAILILPSRFIFQYSSRCCSFSIKNRRNDGILVKYSLSRLLELTLIRCPVGRFWQGRPKMTTESYTIHFPISLSFIILSSGVTRRMTIPSISSKQANVD